MMSWMTDPEVWIALVTLTSLELVLGLDNIVFISIMAARVEPDLRRRARRVGLGLAMLTRIALLFSLAWLIRLTAPLLRLFAHDFSGRDLILVAGGLFLLVKATHEIHQKIEGGEEGSVVPAKASFTSVLIQIMLLDVIFSFDSVITAVGMAERIEVMVAAVVAAVVLMMLFADAVGDFVEHHPTIKMLALAFLLLIGMTLVADGLGQHIPKGYVYFAMGFSVFVEMLNLRMGRPVVPRSPDRSS